MYINFLFRTLYCTETLFTCFVHKNMKETALESSLLYKKNAEIFSIALRAQPAQKQKNKIKFYLSFYSAWDI